MSDRIDELVAAIDANTLLQWDGKDVALVAAHELATIAREAEAMCEWLAGELYDEDYLGLYTRAARTSENEPYTPSDRVADIATIVATARAAVEQEADARALIWQLTTENTQKLLNEAIARAIEKEQKCREAAAALAATEQEEAE